eukprot:264750-Chlamydomonas_euryale.AAC.1
MHMLVKMYIKMYMLVSPSLLRMRKRIGGADANTRFHSLPHRPLRGCQHALSLAPPPPLARMPTRAFTRSPIPPRAPPIPDHR